MATDRFSDSLADTVSDAAASNAGDWPARASETVVRYVGTVRDKTTGPALVASRYAVYALALALIGVMLAILLLVLLVRVLVSGTGELSFVDEGETWLAYYILGFLFVVAGMVLWRKKER